MDLETVFLSRFSIRKKPNIFELIGAAIQIGAWKHPTEFEKRRHGLLSLLMCPENLGDDVFDFEDDNVIDSGVAEIKDEESFNNGGAGIEESDSGLTEIEEKRCRFQETRYQENNDVSKIKYTVNKTQGGKCRIITSAMGSAATNKFTKRSAAMSNMKSVEESNGFKGLTQTTKEKQSHKVDSRKLTQIGFNANMTVTVKKTKEGTQQTPIQSNIKNSTEDNIGSATKVCSTLGSKKRSPMTKMNVAIKRVQVAPPHDKLFLSDCSQQKKQNNSNNGDLKESWATKFESSKRKFDERVEEINKAKRRVIVMDYHDLPKPAKDPSAPRRCWDRRRF